MKRTCVACQAQPAITLREYTPLCGDCPDRTGEGIVPGARVVLDSDPDGHYTGVVDRLENEGYLAVVSNVKGEAYLPVVELVRVIADEVVSVVD